MSAKRPVAVLVDAYTSAKYLPPAFHALGADLVHVRGTSEFLPSMPEPDLSPYRAEVVHTDLDATVAALQTYAPVCVLAGQEPGVQLADALAERLGLAGNRTALSEARRDKYQMVEQLRAAGLHVADQLAGDDVEELVRWSERTGYPVVVKPLRSAAGDSVFVCADAEQVRAAAEVVLASETIYAEPNRVALIQSYLHGVEHVVDMVSYAGRRYVCGVWAYHKRLLPSGRNIYDREYLLAADAPPAPELIAYVQQALDALGIDYGPTHAEVMYTPDGPALVEVGARISGNMHPAVHDEAMGGNQAALSALAFLHPERFLAEYADRRYAKRREALCCTTSTTLSGVVECVDEAVTAQIAALNTVHRLDLKLGPGDILRPTVDLYSSTMRIFMTAASLDDIDHDCRRIEELKDGVYRLRHREGG